MLTLISRIVVNKSQIIQILPCYQIYVLFYNFIFSQSLQHSGLRGKMKKKNSMKNKKNVSQTETEAIKKKKLTSRQRKALTKIIEKKQKSQKRSEMLNELKSLELSAPSLSLMTSISQTQTTGLRNALKEKKKCQTTKPIEENRSSDEMTVDEEDVGSELDEDEIA